VGGGAFLAPYPKLPQPAPNPLCNRPLWGTSLGETGTGEPPVPTNPPIPCSDGLLGSSGGCGGPKEGRTVGGGARKAPYPKLPQPAPNPLCNRPLWGTSLGETGKGEPPLPTTSPHPLQRRPFGLERGVWWGAKGRAHRGRGSQNPGRKNRPRMGPRP
jgi:hypothetical protein